MSKEALVSILIPVYNRESIISETIKSAQLQDYNNIEIIVVDNNSTDNTWEIILRHASTDDRIKAFKNEVNLGPVRNWKRCIDEAKGIYGKILWSDDLLSSDFISKTIPNLNNNDVGFVYSSAVIFDEFNNERVTYEIGGSGLYDTKQYIDNKILEKGSYPYSPGCAVFRLKDLKANLVLDVENKINSDFSMHGIGSDLLIYLLTANSYKYFYYLNENLARFREHSSSISVKSSIDGKLSLHYMVAKATFMEKHNNDKGLLMKFNSDIYAMLLVFKKNPYGLNSISDFYMTNTNYRVNYFYFFSKMFDFKRIVKVFKHIKERLI